MTCWNCGEEISREGNKVDEGFVACAKCGAPDFIGDDRSPFAVFGAPKQFNLDQNVLEQRYLALSKWLHPDRYSTLGDRWKLKCGEFSALLNEAYQTLRNDDARLDALLGAHGAHSNDRKQSGSIPTEFTEKFFELQELRFEDPVAAEQLAAELKKEVIERERDLHSNLVKVASDIDWNYKLDPEKIETLRSLREKRSYLRSLAQNLEKRG